MTGTLYIVATPIGNLGDVSKRALETLKGVDLVLAEDTRVTSKLLRHYDIDTHTLSYHQHSSDAKKTQILSELLNGKNIALVTDAGTPGISDPGNELIDHLKGYEPLINVIPIPGPSSLTTALSVSGMNLSRFVFAGFLPKKGWNKKLDQVKTLGFPVAFFESPKRILKTLDRLEPIFGPDAKVLVARELTKLHETLYRGTLAEVRSSLVAETHLKGELVVVIEFV